MAESFDPDTGEILPPEGRELVSGDSSAAIAIARAEIDALVSTAKQYPRSSKLAQQRILDYVTLDKAAAEECMYSLPRGNKPITGPSIRFAEALKTAWGNCSAETYISGMSRTEMWIEATAIFRDLETNTATKVSRRRSIKQRNGRIFSDDMIVVAGNAATSIAMREAILQGIPKPVWRSAYEHVVQVIRGDQRTLNERRGAAVKAFQQFGVPADKVLAFLEVSAEDEITADMLLNLTSIYRTIRDGEHDAEAYFSGKPARAVDSSSRSISEPLADGGNDPGGETSDSSANSQRPSGGSDPKPASAPEKDADGDIGGGEPAAEDEGNDFPGDRKEPATEQPKASGKKESPAPEEEKPVEEKPKATKGAKAEPEEEAKPPAKAGLSKEPTQEELNKARANGKRRAKFTGAKEPKVPDDLQEPGKEALYDAFVEGWMEYANGA